MTTEGAVEAQNTETLNQIIIFNKIKKNVKYVYFFFNRRKTFRIDRPEIAPKFSRPFRPRPSVAYRHLVYVIVIIIISSNRINITINMVIVTFVTRLFVTVVRARNR